MPGKPRPKRKRVLLDIRAVGQILGVGDTTVRKLVKLGHLRKPRMVAGSPRWFAVDVKVYLARLRSGDFDGCGIEQKPAKSRGTQQSPAKPNAARNDP